MADRPLSWRVRVTGHVQGVYYRAYTREQAQALGVCGWVSNLQDGSVTALLQHPDETVLAKMLATMQQGPPGSRVDDVGCSTLEDAELLAGFVIRR